MQATEPWHWARLPFAQSEKWAQHPTIAQSHVPGSTNTEWQSLRVSHSANVVTCEHGSGHTIPGQGDGRSLGRVQPTKVCP
jgi:hypothetical protein